MLCGKYIYIYIYIYLLFYVESFSYMSWALLCGEVLVHVLYACPSLLWLEEQLTNQCITISKVCQVESAQHASAQTSVMMTWVFCLGSCQILCCIVRGENGRRQENVYTAHPRRVTNKLGTISADETQPLRSEFDCRRIPLPVTDLWFPVRRLRYTYSHSFQWPLGYTFNRHADKHNMQWLEMGMRGQWGGDKMDKCLQWVGGSCLCQWTVIWKSENMWCGCNVLYALWFFYSADHVISAMD